MISILMDQGLAPRAAPLLILRERGFKATHVSEAGLAQRKMLKFWKQRGNPIRFV